MLNIVQILSRVIGDGECIRIFNVVAQRNNLFFNDLAIALNDCGRYEEALSVCNMLLNESPTNIEILLLSVKILSVSKGIESALERLISINKMSLSSSELANETRTQMMAAVSLQSKYISTGNYEAASNIVDLLVKLCPGVLIFHESNLEMRSVLLQVNDERATALRAAYFSCLNRLASLYNDNSQFDKELTCRLEIYNHPLFAGQHSAVRLQNILSILGRLLDCSVDRPSAENVSVAKNLIQDGINTPPTKSNNPSGVTIDADRFDTFYRLLLEAIDLDTVLGPAVEQLPLLPAYFVSATGAAMDISAVAERSKQLGARVVFTTSASPEYFKRYTRTYITSILKSCDCNCIIMICICTPKENILKAIKDIGIDDQRIIYYSDDFDVSAKEYVTFTSETGKSLAGAGQYYAVASHMRADYVINYLRLPVFITGIDTVLQKGVVELLEQFNNCDVVFSMGSPKFLIGSQLINNIVFINPTQNALLFIQFIKKYLGRNLSQKLQPAFLDQLDIHMAKIHLMARGDNPVISYFNEFDINNMMFTHSDYWNNQDLVKRYRFLNMFIAGCSDNAMTAEDVA